MPKLIDETKIFDAALKMFISHGYEGATMHKIAEISDVNEVTLFRKYRSKTGLFEKVINHRFSETPLNKLVYTGSLEADLLAIVEAYMETSETYGDVVSNFLIELPRNPDLQGSFNVLWKNIQIILKIIQQYQAQGLLKEESPLVSLSVLIGPIMVNQMFRRASLHLPVPKINPRDHVDSFLIGRKL